MLGTTGNPLTRLFSKQEVKEKDEPQVVRLPPSLWDRLSVIAQKETEKAIADKPKALVISRNDVIKKVLLEFAEVYDSEEAGAQPTEKKAKKSH